MLSKLKGVAEGLRVSHFVDKHLAARLRLAAHWRVKEPVVVFESDDWGLDRRDVRGELARFGEPNAYAREVHENPEDLERLYRVLDRLRDDTGRPAVFTANFVVANPDFDAIRDSRFEHYADVPISSWIHKEAWLEGMKRRVFYPQYHGRSHFAQARWLSDLRGKDPTATALFDARVPAGLAVGGHTYRSEYLDLTTGTTPDDLADWIEGGIKTFESLFGFLPTTAIPPHYSLGGLGERALLKAGVRSIQGMGYRHRPDIVRHVLGERMDSGLLCLHRTVRFEPCREHSAWSVEAAISNAEICFARKLPVVVDSHRMNYTGNGGSSSVAALHSFLESLAGHAPRYLTSPELAQAIEQDGAYTDVFSGEARTLQPLDGTRQTALRLCLASVHRRLESHT